MAGNSAKFETDFIGSITTLHFANGQTSASTVVDIVNDDIEEGTEDFRIHLTASEGGTLGSSNQISVTIFDDDGVINTGTPKVDVDEGNSAEGK